MTNGLQVDDLNPSGYRILDVTADGQIKDQQVSSGASIHCTSGGRCGEGGHARATAGDDEVSLCQRGIQIDGLGHTVSASESGGTAGGRMDLDLSHAAGVQLGARCSGVGTGSHDEDASPVEVHLLGDEVQANGHHGAPLGSQCRLSGDMAGGLERLLDDVADDVRNRLFLARLIQSTLHLSGDLALTDNHRLQASSHPEHPPDGVVLTEDLGRVSQHRRPLVGETGAQRGLVESLSGRVGRSLHDQAHSVAR